MELMPAEEIFEVNSNSTTDTLKEQRLARNKELRLKATYLVSRRPVKAQQQKEYNSESSSEFPASSPSNPQMQKKSQYQTRPPLLKNTLPADAFERGLALIATKEPQMSMNEKIESWQCVTDEFSDVEDVVNFDAAFEQREENKIKQLSKTKYDLKNKSPQKDDGIAIDQNSSDACYSFTEFQRRLLAIDPRKTQTQCNEQKNNSKLTSEEDEKPTTSSNCLARNRDTPLKKRACKYKRAAEPIAHLPNKKSSSSDTPRDGAPSPKKKIQQQQQQPKLSAANAAGEDIHLLNEKMVCPSSSDASSHLMNRNDNTNAVAMVKNIRSLGQSRSKSTKVIETNAINSNWNRTIATKASIPRRNDEQESFFRWRRLSREIDKLGSLKGTQHIENKAYQQPQEKNTCQPPQQKSEEKQGLIQIRYDFLAPISTSTKTVPETNAYNVVVKPLTNCKSQEGILKEPAGFIPSEPKIRIEALFSSKSYILKGETNNFVKTEQPKETQSACTIDEIGEQDFDNGFNQQHEFCNYLGLTGMSTANAMATAAAELSRCKLARRSLRVRHLEQRKAKNKSKLESSKTTREKVAKNKQEKLNNSSKNTMIPASEKSLENNIQNSKSSTTENSNTAENLTPNDKVNKQANITSCASVPFKHIAKEKESKIKILCQISACSKENEKSNKADSEKSIKCTLQRRKLRPNDESASKSTTSKPLHDLHIDQIKAEEILCDNYDIKCLDLMPKQSKERKSPNDDVNGADEIQKLHKKVQKCLEEARQHTPNIFIIQSLDSTDKNQPINDKDNVAESKHSARSRSKTPTTTPDNKKENKRLMRSNIKRNTNRNKRQLYTRSMLNLNQQRELRNRKVILKILKAYSGLKIKVSKPKNKNENRKTKTVSTIALNSEKSIDISNAETSSPIASQKAYDAQLKKNRKKFQNTKIYRNAVRSLRPFNNETNAVFENQNLSTESIENMSQNSEQELLVTPSNILTSETSPNLSNSENTNKISTISVTEIDTIVNHDKTVEVAVQTDPIPLTERQQAKPVEISVVKTQENSLPQRCVNAEMDVSSSDMVTSTTSGVGDQNRCDPKILPHLVKKGQYRNFFVDENVIVGPDLLLSESKHFVEINRPPTNVNISSAINERGVHSLCKPSKALRNPLQATDGLVLHIFYELDILIVVQEALVSFWKYIRVLNALAANPRDVDIEELNLKGRRMFTGESQPSPSGAVSLGSPDLNGFSTTMMQGCEWIYLGECKRLSTDIEIHSPYINRLCLSESRPVYIEMRCRELINDFRECNLLSCYVNVYFFNEEDQAAMCHSIQLDSIQSLPSDVIYTSINESRYFVLAWPQANVLGKVRSGLCKYALTPELDMLATTRDFKAMRHALRSLECLNDGKLLGFGDTQLTVWDHRSGDVLMNFDLSLSLGRNLGTIYYPSIENDQNNVVIMIQHVRSETSSDLIIIACIISHNNPSHKILLQYRLPVPLFQDISYGINNGEHFIIRSGTGEEILINCNDPRQLIFVPAQNSEHFYTRGRTQVVELTKQSLTVDSFSSYLLKISSGLKEQQKPISDNMTRNKNWCV